MVGEKLRQYKINQVADYLGRNAAAKNREHIILDYEFGGKAGRRVISRDENGKLYDYALQKEFASMDGLLRYLGVKKETVTEENVGSGFFIENAAKTAPTRASATKTTTTATRTTITTPAAKQQPAAQAPAKPAGARVQAANKTATTTTPAIMEAPSQKTQARGPSAPRDYSDYYIDPSEIIKQDETIRKPYLTVKPIIVETPSPATSTQEQVQKPAKTTAEIIQEKKMMKEYILSEMAKKSQLGALNKETREKIANAYVETIYAQNIFSDAPLEVVSGGQLSAWSKQKCDLLLNGADNLLVVSASQGKMKTPRELTDYESYTGQREPFQPIRDARGGNEALNAITNMNFARLLLQDSGAIDAMIEKFGAQAGNYAHLLVSSPYVLGMDYLLGQSGGLERMANAMKAFEKISAPMASEMAFAFEGLYRHAISDKKAAVVFKTPQLFCEFISTMEGVFGTGAGLENALKSWIAGASFCYEQKEHLPATLFDKKALELFKSRPSDLKYLTLFSCEGVASAKPELKMQEFDKRLSFINSMGLNHLGRYPTAVIENAYLTNVGGWNKDWPLSFVIYAKRDNKGAYLTDHDMLSTLAGMNRIVLCEGDDEKEVVSRYFGFGYDLPEHSKIGKHFGYGTKEHETYSYQQLSAHSNELSMLLGSAIGTDKNELDVGDFDALIGYAKKYIGWCPNLFEDMMTLDGLVFIYGCLGGAEPTKKALEYVKEKYPYMVSDVSDYTNIMKLFSTLFQRNTVAATTELGSVRLLFEGNRVVGVEPKREDQAVTFYDARIYSEGL